MASDRGKALIRPVAASALGTTARAASPADWIEGYEAGRQAAQKQNRLAFIYFDAEWCSWCQRYKRETLVDPAVRRELARYYVTVQVDFDARPDLVKRYGVRGLPYTLMLAPDGKVLNGFVGLLTPKDMADLLRDYAERFPPAADGQATEIIARSGRLDRRGFEEFRRAFLAHVERLYEPEVGTLAGRYESGATLKRPSPLTWMYLAKDKTWRERAARAARVEYRRLHDPVDGGFFNFLDPLQPGGDYTESSKLLEGNAWLTLWMHRAGDKQSELKSAAASGWRYLREVLWDAKDGGFWQAQIADQRYYALPPARRRTIAPPPLDRMKRADTNAQAAWALIRYAGTRQKRPHDYAAGAVDFVLADLWHDGQLYHHVRDGVLSTPGQPLDLFWLLGAGAELERIRANVDRRRRLRAVAEAAAEWLNAEMRAAESPLPEPELAGLIAWVAERRALYQPLPRGGRDWALNRLHLRTDTPPDDLVLGLMAWEQALGNKT